MNRIRILFEGLLFLMGDYFRKLLFKILFDPYFVCFQIIKIEFILGIIY